MHMNERFSNGHIKPGTQRSEPNVWPHWVGMMFPRHAVVRLLPRQVGFTELPLVVSGLISHPPQKTRVARAFCSISTIVFIRRFGFSTKLTPGRSVYIRSRGIETKQMEKTSRAGPGRARSCMWQVVFLSPNYPGVPGADGARKNMFYFIIISLLDVLFLWFL